MYYVGAKRGEGGAGGGWGVMLTTLLLVWSRTGC